MRKAVFDLLNEAQKKMSGFAVYMNYQFIHFSVQAEPAALLAIEVELNNVRMNLEDVADIILPNETQFGIIPKSQSYLFPILLMPACALSFSTLNSGSEMFSSISRTMSCRALSAGDLTSMDPGEVMSSMLSCSRIFF